MKYFDEVKRAGNFAFLREFDTELYEKLLHAERKAWLDYPTSAIHLRRAMECFFTKHTDISKLSQEINPKLADSMKLFFSHNMSKQQNRMSNIRRFGNNYVHANPVLDFKKLIQALSDMHDFLRDYYHVSKGDEMSFYRNYMPIGPYFIDSAQERSADSDCFLRCIGHTDKPWADAPCALIKIYNRNTAATNRVYKEFEALQRVWSSRPPQYVLPFSEFTESSESSSEFLVLRYQLKGPPMFLTTSYLQTMSVADRLKLLYQIILGVEELHTMVPPIYHRNLCPESVLLYCEGGCPVPYIIDFEYAKLPDGVTQTVISRVVKREQTKAPYIAPEVRQYITDDSRCPQWDKADIYSLGAIAVYILIGQDITGIIPLNKLAALPLNDSLCSAIRLAVSPNAGIRSSLSDLKQAVLLELAELDHREVMAHART